MYNERDPVIWMNVSTSAAWTRPPVGIVRVEVEVAEALERSLGPNKFKRCVWTGGEFVAWSDPKKSKSSRDIIDTVVDQVLPDRPTLTQARGLMSEALRAIVQAGVASDEGASDRLNVSFPTKGSLISSPRRGDFLISIGLDWDSDYAAQFVSLNRDKGIRIITCCYDLIPVLFPHYCVGDVAHRFKDYFGMITWGSEAVLCISQNTLRDYQSLCRRMGAPERDTAVIPLGDNVAVVDGSAPGSQINQLLSVRYILFVSTIERRKNHEVLYRAYRLLLEESPAIDLPTMVFVGMPGWGVGDLMKDIELDPLTKGKLVQLNHVTDNDLAYLYKHAYFCAYPSLYEGWGLPVAEALTAGKMVIASAKGSLPEVGGDLVTYLDPWSPREWADEIKALTLNPDEVRRREARVRSEYVPRLWSGAATVIRSLIDTLSSESKSSGETLYPGYDMRTQVGIHVGSKIRSCGNSGFLLFGPYRSLEPGEYHWTLNYTILSEGAGSMYVELVAGSETETLWNMSVEWSDDTSKMSARTLEFDVNVARFTDPYELRIMIGASLVEISCVSFRRKS